jgi:hypothetical protein
MGRVANRVGVRVGGSVFVGGARKAGTAGIRTPLPLTRAAHEIRYTLVAHATATAHGGRPAQDSNYPTTGSQNARVYSICTSTVSGLPARWKEARTTPAVRNFP